MVFNCSIDYKLYSDILEKNKIAHLLERLAKIVKEFDNYAYLSLTPRQLKLKKKEVLDKLSRI